MSGERLTLEQRLELRKQAMMKPKVVDLEPDNLPTFCCDEWLDYEEYVALKAQLNLNDDQVREFKDAFDIFDEDCGGTVTTAELSNVMKALGQDISEDDVAVMISEVDSDGSGEIDFAEFCTLMARQMEKADPEYEYKKAFKIFDKRGDGFIDPAELKHIMLNIGEDMGDGEIAEMIKEADIDGDGKLAYNEFLNIMLSK